MYGLAARNWHHILLSFIHMHPRVMLFRKIPAVEISEPTYAQYSSTGSWPDFTISSLREDASVIPSL
jgi:hypothetical protein